MLGATPTAQPTIQELCAQKAAIEKKLIALRLELKKIEAQITKLTGKPDELPAHRLDEDKARLSAQQYELARKVRRDGRGIRPRGQPGRRSAGGQRECHIDDGTRKCAYDALNRLTEAGKIDTPDVEIAEYAYDAMNRRIRKEIKNGGLPGTLTNGKTDYLYRGVQCVEERDPEGGVGQDEDTPLRQYVWGAYVDELIQQRDLGDPDVDYYLLSDLLYRSVALTDASKTIAETYDTDAYGRTLIFSGDGADDLWFTDDDDTTDDPTCPFIFTGRRYDPETQIYFYRARYYDPEMGRFLSRDPIGYADGMGLYEYVGGHPVSGPDPFGLGDLEDFGEGVKNWAKGVADALAGEAVGALAWIFA